MLAPGFAPTEGPAPVSHLDAAALLVVLAALLGYLNYRFIGLPHTIGLTIIGAIASLGVILVDRLIPGTHLGAMVGGFLGPVRDRCQLGCHETVAAARHGSLPPCAGHPGAGPCD